MVFPKHKKYKTVLFSKGLNTIIWEFQGTMDPIQTFKGLGNSYIWIAQDAESIIIIESRWSLLSLQISQSPTLTIHQSLEIYYTPQTNIAPKNEWLEDYHPFGARPIFQGGNVIFREGI